MTVLLRFERDPYALRTMRFERIPFLTGAHGIGGHADEFKNDRLPFLRRVSREGDIVRTRFYGRTLVMISGPEIAHEVLVEKARAFEKSPATRLVLYPLAGEGLFTANGDLWRQQRKLMAPMFHHAQIASFAECMTTCAHRTTDGFVPGATVDVARATTQVAMSVVGKALFDAETFDEADELGEALTTALSWSDSQMGTPWLVGQLMLQLAIRKLGDRLGGPANAMTESALARLQMPFAYRLPSSGPMRRAIGVIDARIARMIADRRAVGLAREDLLTQLLRAQDEDTGGRMDDKQVRDEAVTLFVAGHETTATGLAWAFYELARDPGLYEQVQREGDALGGRAPRMDELSKLGLSLRVFKEALRKYPPVYVVARESTAEIEIGGYSIPEHTIVIVSPYSMHFNPAVYPDPDRFDPSRFEPAAESARHRSAWLPFGGGPRVCIGNHFAMLEGQIVLATMARRVTFAIPDGRVVEPAPLATLRPRGGMPMIVRPRDARSHADGALAAVS
jgi:cytochrome P450